MFEASLCLLLRPEVRLGLCGSGWLALIGPDAAAAGRVRLGAIVLGVVLDLALSLLL